MVVNITRRTQEKLDAFADKYWEWENYDELISEMIDELINYIKKDPAVSEYDKNKSVSIPDTITKTNLRLVY